MGTILDLSDRAKFKGQPGTIWRDELLPASFRGQQFHCESSSKTGGRHIVVHEFPKRDIPYAEDMGRKPKEFTVRGYCIVYPFTSPKYNLYNRDYRVPRDSLLGVLDDGQPGVLQLPTWPALYVRCSNYRLTEEEKLGGYCVFDMSFVEYGYQPGVSGPDTSALLAAASQLLKQRVKTVLSINPHATPGIHPGL
jgi:prophage DNA circulation protein